MEEFRVMQHKDSTLPLLALKVEEKGHKETGPLQEAGKRQEIDPAWNPEKRMQPCHTLILTQSDSHQISDLQNCKITVNIIFVKFFNSSNRKFMHSTGKTCFLYKQRF